MVGPSAVANSTVSVFEVSPERVTVNVAVPSASLTVTSLIENDGGSGGSTAPPLMTSTVSKYLVPSKDRKPMPPEVMLVSVAVTVLSSDVPSLS